MIFPLDRDDPLHEELSDHQGGDWGHDESDDQTMDELDKLFKENMSNLLRMERQLIQNESPKEPEETPEVLAPSTSSYSTPLQPDLPLFRKRPLEEEQPEEPPQLPTALPTPVPVPMTNQNQGPDFETKLWQILKLDSQLVVVQSLLSQGISEAQVRKSTKDDMINYLMIMCGFNDLIAIGVATLLKNHFPN